MVLDTCGDINSMSQPLKRLRATKHAPAGWLRDIKLAAIEALVSSTP